MGLLDSKEETRKVLELSDYRMVEEYKINVRKSIACLHKNNKTGGFDIKKLTIYYTVSFKVRYLV